MPVKCPFKQSKPVAIQSYEIYCFLCSLQLPRKGINMTPYCATRQYLTCCPSRNLQWSSWKYLSIKGIDAHEYLNSAIKAASAHFCFYPYCKLILQWDLASAWLNICLGSHTAGAVKIVTAGRQRARPALQPQQLVSVHSGFTALPTLPGLTIRTNSSAARTRQQLVAMRSNSNSRNHYHQAHKAGAAAKRRVG